MHKKLKPKKCKGCKTIFQPKRNDSKYCSSSCFGKHNKKARANLISRQPGFVSKLKGRLRLDMTGEKHFMFGKKHSKKTRKIISLKTKQAWDNGIYDAEYKKNQSRAQRKAVRKRPNWKGGISKLNSHIRAHYLYKEWRQFVFERDNFTCKRCGTRGGELEVHHKISFSNILEKYSIKTMEDADKCKQLWDVENGETYCIFCHAEVDEKRKQTLKKNDNF